MPQLDFSYYISQITWLLFAFVCFFCISRFLILPQLNRILTARSSFINTNVNFAQEVIDKAKKINQDCDENIKNNSRKIEEIMSNEIAKIKEFNSNKISDLKKKMNEEKNRNILQIKQDLQKISKELNLDIQSIVLDILKKVYSINPDKKIIENLYDKYMLV